MVDQELMLLNPTMEFPLLTLLLLPHMLPWLLQWLLPLTILHLNSKLKTNSAIFNMVTLTSTLSNKK